MKTAKKTKSKEIKVEVKNLLKIKQSFKSIIHV